MDRVRQNQITGWQMKGLRDLQHVRSLSQEIEEYKVKFFAAKKISTRVTHAATRGLWPANIISDTGYSR
jgi:hypothetical protein